MRCAAFNFGSLGILHDPAGSPPWRRRRRQDVISLGFKSIVSDTLSACLIGAIVKKLLN